MDKERFLAATAEETIELGKKFAQLLPKGSTVFLQGELGAGKTTFVKGMAEAFQVIREEVASPTFQYLNIYKGSKTLCHFDLYRLENESQFFDMGFDEFFNEETICCVEWAERLHAFCPKQPVHVTLSHHEQGRAIEIWHS